MSDSGPKQVDDPDYHHVNHTAAQTCGWTANDILFNPEATISVVERSYEQQAEAETNRDGQAGLESQLALAQIERVGKDVREKAEQFEQRETMLRERFTQAQESDQ